MRGADKGSGFGKIGFENRRIVFEQKKKPPREQKNTTNNQTYSYVFFFFFISFGFAMFFTHTMYIYTNISLYCTSRRHS